MSGFFSFYFVDCFFLEAIPAFRCIFFTAAPLRFAATKKDAAAIGATFNIRDFRLKSPHAHFYLSVINRTFAYL
ncbi:hypothetical protein ASG01_13940 [Chryseobacterium sp. Leaf180]|nr:hypothetical protein ASG01_13940 [Chryseobacterium sp. Leaf180]